MNAFNKKFNIAIIPILLLGWGIFLMTFYDPFYSRSQDPEYPYLINGLNCATLNFNYIGHIDHPGTPFQVYNGIMIQITHLISGNGSMVQDVFARPEHYLNAISASMFLIQAFLIFLVGLFGFKRKIPFWQIALLQASFLFSDVLMYLCSRANPDRFFMIAGLIFIIIYLKHGYENRSPLKFALWSGTAMALGMATKFNFLPVLILPLLLIDTNKNRLIYAGSGIVSFFILISPIIDKFDDYYRFLKSIFSHDGLYGSGDANVMNFQKMKDSTFDIFKLNPELLILIIALVILIYIAIRKQDEEGEEAEGMKGYIYLFAGYLLIIAIQILLVSKHFKNYYLAPTFIIYGFIFFTISKFLSRIMKHNSRLILVCNILPVLFIVFMAVKVKRELPGIAKGIELQNKTRAFIYNEISKDDIWFIEPTWESGPHVENAIVYGLSYCGHRDQYASQLKAVNPNIITYEGNNAEVKLWRCAPISLDSMVATGKNIYIYSTPGRNAPVLLKMVQESASRNQFQLLVDTVFSNKDLQADIIKVKVTNPSSNWKVKAPAAINKQKIDKFIQSIKNTPEWLEKVRKKAVEKNISLDSMIMLDAIYMSEQEK